MSESNPYQPVAQDTDVVIDLAETIVIRNEVTSRDWQHYFKRTRRREKITLAAFVFATLVGLAQAWGGSAGLTILTAVGLGAFVSLLLYFANHPARHAETVAAHGQTLRGPVTVHADSESIRVGHEDQVWHLFWSGLAKLRMGKDWLVLTLEPHGPELLLLDQSESEDWKKLADALRPVQGAIRLAAGRGRGIEQATRLSGAAPAGAVEFNLAITGRDYSQLSDTITETEKPMQSEPGGCGFWGSTGLLLLAIGGATLAFLASPSRGPAEGWTTRDLVIGIACLLVPFLIMASLYIWYKLALKKQSTSDDVMASLRGWLDDSGVVQIFPGGWQRLPYALMSPVSVEDETAIIRHASRPHYYFLKRSAFGGDQQWNRAMDLLRERTSAS